MRIAVYLPSLETSGGVELSVFEITRELARRGHRICVFCEREGNLSDEFRSFAESVDCGPSPLYSATPFRDAPRIAGRAIAASRRRPDVVYANNISELAWAVGIRALTRAPIVCHLHEFKQVRRASLSVLGGRVSRFVVPSEFMREVWIKHGLEKVPVERIYAGLAPANYPAGSREDRLRVREALGLPADAYVALYMGRLIPEKGVDVLLDAWRSLGLPPERARLLIVGLPPDPDEYVEALQALAPPGCDWRPMRRDTISVLQAADVLVLPSRWDEPFGRVIVEAMATGRPAVAAAVGGIPEILSGEFSGLLFPRGDSAALAERLRTLQDWRQTNPSLAAHCVSHAAANFSLESSVTRLEEIFEGCRGG